MNLLLYSIDLKEPLINYSYYLDLRNVPKNFLINDSIYINDLTFAGDSTIQALVTSDISSNIFKTIVHYSKLGEFPPEPI
jgi:hypothetical protein